MSGPAPYSTLAPMNEIVAILKGVPGMGAVQIGAPLSWSTQLNAYVTLGPQPLGMKAQGVIWRDARYFVDLGYRCDDSSAGVTAAETTLAAALDALEQAIFDDKTLAGTTDEATIETVATEDPEYRMRAGKEFREFSLSVICRQYTSYNPTP